MAVEVVQVQLPKEIKPFLDAWWHVYKGDPHWVPPLRFERKDFFNPKKNPWFQRGKAAFFLARRDGQPVGTISAQLDPTVHEKDPDMGLFGFYEFKDDPEVSEALWKAASDWLREQGMRRARGPFNLTINHECGLLVNGFDGDPLVLMTYNGAYCASHYEKLGMTKAMDLYAYWLDAKKPVPATIQKLSDRFTQRHPEVKIRPVNLKDFDNELKALLTIYNDAWEDNWGAVRMGEEEMRKTVEGIKPMIDPRFCYFAEVNGEPAALSVTLPDYNQVVKPMNGSLLPFGWYHYLTRRSKVDRLRVVVLGVRRKFQHMPLGAPLYMRTWQAGLEAGVVGAEASWILESNNRMRGALEKLGGEIYRTYRIYEKAL